MKNKKEFKLKVTKNYLTLLENKQLELGTLKFESDPIFKNCIFTCYYMILGYTRKNITLAYAPLFINKTKKEISPYFNGNIHFKALSLKENKKTGPLSMWDVICITKISKKEYKSIVSRNKVNIYKDYGSALSIKNSILSMYKQHLFNYIYEKEDILWLFNLSSSYFTSNISNKTNNKKLSPK